jgi:hypothetical protein
MVRRDGKEMPFARNALQIVNTPVLKSDASQFILEAALNRQSGARKSSAALLSPTRAYEIAKDLFNSLNNELVHSIQALGGILVDDRLHFWHSITELSMFDPKLRLPHFRSRNGFCAVQKSFLDRDDEYRARRFSVDRQTHLQSLVSRDTPFAADANTVAVLGNKEEETDLGMDKQVFKGVQPVITMAVGYGIPATDVLRSETGRWSHAFE